MDTERLGIELGDLICETWAESIDDITTTLGRRIDDVSLEYIALLLWIATMEASIVLPDKSFQHASNVAFSVIFEEFLKKTGAEFNVKTFQDFIHDRFKIYYGAFKDPTIDEDDEDNVKVRRNFNVVACFILCCFAREAEYRKVIANEDNSVIASTVPVVGRHYCRFAERVRSVLSRY